MSPESEHVVRRLLQLAGIGLLAALIWGGLYLIRDRVPSPVQPKGGAATSAGESETEARNRALVEEAFAKWGAGTGSPYDLLADDVSWTIVGRSDAAKTYASRQAFMDEVVTPFGARMSQGLKPAIRQLATDGDDVIIFFDAEGVAKDGQPYANTYAWFWEMRDGKVVRAHAFLDSIAFNELWRRVEP
jgi:ketosteroid isomerase-like protein